METTGQLSNTESGAREDGEGCDGETDEEGSEELALVERSVAGVPGHWVAIETERVLESHDGEDEERDDLC